MLRLVLTSRPGRCVFTTTVLEPLCTPRDEGNNQGNLVGHVARWDGEQWIDLNLARTTLWSNWCRSMTAPDQRSPVAGSRKWTASRQRIIRWNGADWEPLPVDLPGSVKRLHVLDAGNGPTLAATGEFSFPIRRGVHRDMGRPSMAPDPQQRSWCPDRARCVRPRRRPAAHRVRALPEPSDRKDRPTGSPPSAASRRTAPAT